METAPNSIVAAPPPTEAAAPAPATTPGPKPFERKSTPANESLDDTLRRHSGQLPKPPEDNGHVKKPEKPDDAKKPDETKPGDVTKPDANAKPGDTKPAPATPEKPPGKFNPVHELKTLRPKLAAAEAEIARLKAGVVPEHERSTLTTRMEQIQKRNEELENLVRFKDYESSGEFQTKYHKPYADSLSTAMEDLSRIPVTDAATGQPRPASEKDLFEIVGLVNNNLADARRRATEVFGDLAPDVMDMAKKVRDTLVARNKALAEEKTNGATREQKQKEELERQGKTIATEFENLWKEENDAVINNPKDPGLAEILKPIEIKEGQQATPEESEHNTALERGFKLVDDAFKMVDTVRRKGTQAVPEERRAVARKMATVRNRAAGFGPLRRKFNALVKKHKEATATLASYESTTPAAGGRQIAPRNGNGKGASSFEQGLTDALTRRAGRR